MAEQSFKEQQLAKQQEAAAQFAMLAIRSLILVSGGSVIAILTFLGNLWTKDDALARMTAQHLQRSLVLLVVALGLSVLTAVGGYVSALAHVYRLTKPRSIFARMSFVLRGLVIFFGLLATCIFGVVRLWRRSLLVDGRNTMMRGYARVSTARLLRCTRGFRCGSKADLTVASCLSMPVLHSSLSAEPATEFMMQ